PRILATARRPLLGVVDDVEFDVAPVPRRHHPEQAADRIGDASVPTDDATHVVLVHAERQERLVTLVVDFDPDRVGLVDQRAGDVLEELLHASAFASPSAPASPAPASSAASGADSGAASSA